MPIILIFARRPVLVRVRLILANNHRIVRICVEKFTSRSFGIIIGSGSRGTLLKRIELSGRARFFFLGN